MHTHYSTFTTIRIEGAILPPDLLQRIADGDAEIGGLSSEAYRLARGEKLNEAIRGYIASIGNFVPEQLDREMVVIEA